MKKTSEACIPILITLKKKDYNSGNICPHRSTIPLQPIQILLNSNGEYFFNPHTTSCCMDGCVDHFMLPSYIHFQYIITKIYTDLFYNNTIIVGINTDNAGLQFLNCSNNNRTV